MKRASRLAKQLPLTLLGSVDRQQDLARCEAYARAMADENARLTAANAKLKTRIERLKEASAKQEKNYQRLIKQYNELREVQVSDQKHPLYREHQELKRSLDEVHRILDYWVRLALQWRDGSSAGVGQRGKRPSKADLNELTKVLHPDRWSQGQPATELAHEAMVLVNKLREGVA